MLISLENLSARLSVRLHLIDRAFERYRLDLEVRKRIDRSAFQEGLVSSLWQSWGAFCRSVIIQSVKGATTAGATVTTSIHSTLNEEQLCYIAKQASAASTYTVGKSIKGSHLEPTWGDISKLGLIVPALAASNGSTMQAAFGYARYLGDLQLCRNAAAHVNDDNNASLRAARVRYIDTTFHHPTDMMFWIEPNAGNIVWKVWLDEMRVTARRAIQ